MGCAEGLCQGVVPRQYVSVQVRTGQYNPVQLSTSQYMSVQASKSQYMSHFAFHHNAPQWLFIYTDSSIDNTIAGPTVSQREAVAVVGWLSEVIDELNPAQTAATPF